MPADVGYDKKRSENHDIYWRESHPNTAPPHTLGPKTHT